MLHICLVIDHQHFLSLPFPSSRPDRLSLFLFLCVVLMKKDSQNQHQQQEHVHVMSEDEAAGLRKQLIRFHCISCDRPIDVQPHAFVSFTNFFRDDFFWKKKLLIKFVFLWVDFRHQPSLPANQGMRPIQSPRPYTTYELDQIRQYQKRFDNSMNN